MSNLKNTDSWRTEPSVTQEKWITHAQKKLARGYVLIVNLTRRNANFYKPGKGYEMCAYGTARHLIQRGYVIETGTHYLGAIYTLSDQEITPLPPAEPPDTPEPEALPLEDEIETLLKSFMDDDDLPLKDEE